ncbi:MAG: hypothetical protein WC976_06320 [Caldisericia bacterium]
MAKKKVAGIIRIAVPENPKIEIRHIAVINQAEIYSDVLERIGGYEAFEDTEYDNAIYRMEALKNILTNPDDDTNETTKIRIENLVKKIGKNVDYVMIVDN